jgi:hypothetical protein
MTEGRGGEKPSRVVHIYNSSYLGCRSRRITVQGQPRKKLKTLFENKQKA